MKNVLFTYITPFHPERGGIGRVTHSLTLELQRRGYTVFYLIYDCPLTVRHEYDYPAKLEYFPSKDLMSQENITFYHNFLKNNNIDVVINQSGNFEDSELYLNRGDKPVKIISVLHSTPLLAYPYLWGEVYPLKNKSLLEKLKRIARIILFPKIKHQFLQDRKNQFRKLLPQTDLVCTLSECFYPELDLLCSGYNSKYIAIPNPNSYPDSVVVKTQKKKDLLYVGMLVPNKRIDRIIRIWNRIGKRYPDWRLVIIGDGNPAYVASLKSLAAGSNVFFGGFQDPLPYYRDASIFCMTSNYEGWGMVLTEAMQWGVVPVAFQSYASITDIIEDNRNGVLVSPFNMKEYEAKLCNLMNNTEKLQTLSVNAMTDIRKFSVQKIVDLWEKVF